MLTSKGRFLSLGERLASEGWDVVLPDLRAHGASGGKYLTWGAKEKHDIKAVVDSLVAEKLIEPRIYVMGASLGGCVAIQYAAIDSRCKGVLAMAPPAGARDAARLIFPLATKGWLARTIAHAGQIADFDPDDASAVDAAAQLRCPLILVHGSLDFTVPQSHTERIHAAAGGPRKRILIPWATHAGVQIGRNGWIAEQVAALVDMEAGRPGGSP
jgi:pimeloyl-ACP methyl ester carboxylesterase